MTTDKEYRIIKRETHSGVQYIVQKKVLWWWTYAQTIDVDDGISCYISHETLESAREWIRIDCQRDKVID